MAGEADELIGVGAVEGHGVDEGIVAGRESMPQRGRIPAVQRDKRRPVRHIGDRPLAGVRQRYAPAMAQQFCRGGDADLSRAADDEGGARHVTPRGGNSPAAGAP